MSLPAEASSAYLHGSWKKCFDGKERPSGTKGGKMKEVFEEYGGIILGTVAAAALTGIIIGFLFGGQIYDAILEFSWSIC